MMPTQTFVAVRRLLIVDDDSNLLSALAQAMRRRGFDVCDVRSVTAARAALSHSSFQYAVVDLRLDRDSGLELINDLVSSDPAIKIVIMTGYASIATAVEAIKRGAIHYLAKPVDAHQICTAFGDSGTASQPPKEMREPSLQRLQWEYIDKTLLEHQGNISAAARALRLHRRTLQRKLAKRPVKA